MPDRIMIAELFGPTIQGEGAIAGQVSHFVRTFGCSFRCTWCFGVLPGEHVPKIITARGRSKKITDVRVGDILLTFDQQTRDLVETTVTDCGSRQVPRFLKLTIAGLPYFVTHEHPFFTTRGMIEAQALQVGDMVLHATPRDKISWSKRGDANPMRNPEVAARSSENTDRDKLSRALVASHQRRKEAGVLIGFATWTKEQHQKHGETTAERMRGAGNPNWKGGVFTNLTKLKAEISGRTLPCQRCGQEAILEVHHKDGNDRNDAWENFEQICHRCHSQEHARGRNFWQGPRRDGKTTALPVPRNGLEVQAIEQLDTPLTVYNFTCNPHNTYLVDYMWVHNCDSMHAVDPKQAHMALRMTEKEIIKRLDELGPAPWITLTGGDPVAWDLHDLVTELKLLGYKVAAETQAYLWNDWVELCDLVTCSPKPPSSGMAERFKTDQIRFYYARLGKRMALKIVVFDERDLAWAAAVAQLVPEAGLYLSAGTPQIRRGIRKAVCKSFRWLCETVVQVPELHRAIVLPQLHVLAWQGHLER